MARKLAWALVVGGGRNSETMLCPEELWTALPVGGGRIVCWLPLGGVKWFFALYIRLNDTEICQWHPAVIDRNESWQGTKIESNSWSVNAIRFSEVLTDEMLAAVQAYALLGGDNELSVESGLWVEHLKSWMEVLP